MGTVSDGTGLASNYDVTLDCGTLTVNPYAFTYTIADDSQTYGTAADFATDLGTTINTGVNGENLDIAYTSSGDTDTADVGSYGIMGTVSDGTGLASNYDVTLNCGTLTVNPYAFTYTIGDDSQTYGTAANLATDLGTTINTGVNGENLDIAYASSGDTDTADVGSYGIMGTVSDGTGLASNYDVTLTCGTLTVNPYAFTYTIADDSQTYGTAADLATDLGTTINTGVNGENLDIAYTSSGDTDTADVGTYGIMGTVSDGTGLASDYDVTLTCGTLTVNPYAFTYTIANDSQTYGTAADLATDLGTTINTGVNGENLDIAYTSSGDTDTADVGSYAITGTVSDGTGTGQQLRRHADQRHTHRQPVRLHLHDRQRQPDLRHARRPRHRPGHHHRHRRQRREPGYHLYQHRRHGHGRCRQPTASPAPSPTAPDWPATTT